MALPRSTSRRRRFRDVEGGEGFYPQSLEKGQRSERALRLIILVTYRRDVALPYVAGGFARPNKDFETEISVFCATID